jgi:hypothetical protein
VVAGVLNDWHSCRGLELLAQLQGADVQAIAQLQRGVLLADLPRNSGLGWQ